jgi:hypothetical protein
MNRSAPPGCLASKSVAPSPIITSDDKPCFSCGHVGELLSVGVAEERGKEPESPSTTPTALPKRTLMCFTAAALPPLLDVNSSASKPA